MVNIYVRGRNTDSKKYKIGFENDNLTERINAINLPQYSTALVFLKMTDGTAPAKIEMVENNSVWSVDVTRAIVNLGASIEAQLQIEFPDGEDVAVWQSSIFTFEVGSSINADDYIVQQNPDYLEALDARVAQNAENAAVSETAAALSEQNAATSESNAATSASKAATSEANANQSAKDSLQSSVLAEKSANASASSAISSAQSAVDSANSAAASEESSQTAQQAAEDATNAKDEAESIASHPPLIGDDTDWLLWDEDSKSYVDSDNPSRGIAATIQVGTVTTGEAGSAVSVVNVGTENDAMFNFTIPQGVKGNVLYATFTIENGVLIMTTPDEYDGATFQLNGKYLEVTVDG